MLPNAISRPTGARAPAAPHSSAGPLRPVSDWRLHKHADYQRVYGATRKQFSSLMTFFAAPQPMEGGTGQPRVGITAGKVMGKAVDRNRIKRRMRAAIVANLALLPNQVDVVLHPKRLVLEAEWPALLAEVKRVFEKIARGAPQGTAGSSQARP